MASRISEQIIEWLTVGGNAFNSQTSVPLLINKVGVSSATIPSSSSQIAQYINQGQLWILGAAAASATTRSGQIIISSSNSGQGGAAALELWRGTNASWQIINDGGKLYFKDNWSTNSAIQTTYANTAVTLQLVGGNTNVTFGSRSIAPVMQVHGKFLANDSIESAKFFMQNIPGSTLTDNGYHLRSNNVQYARLYIQTAGTANSGENNETQGAIGLATLVLGNSTASPASGTAGGANNARGRIVIYASNANYTEIYAQGNGNRTFYLPNYNNTMYAVHAGSNSAVGNVYTPIYVAANGRVTIAKALPLYEARAETTTLNKAANYVGAGAMFHLIASSSTDATDNGKPSTDANILQMNWDNSGGYDSQLGIATSQNRMYFRSAASSKTAWREVAHIAMNTATGSGTKGVYVTAAGVVTAMTYELKATINVGTANQVAYYSGANAISSKAPAWEAWVAGTSAGPQAKIQIGNATYTSAAIPSAAAGASGIVTTGAQQFDGNKTFKGHIYPQATNTYNLGDSSHKWSNVYATTFNGNLVGIADWAKLLRPIATTTTASASTWNIPSGSVQVWGERFSDNTLQYTPSGGSATTITDTGDLVMWLTPNATSNVATLNIRIDGTYYGSFSGSLSGNASTATALTSNAGSLTQPIYFNNGKPAATTYSLNATVNSGTVNRIAYYSGANTISASGLSYINTTDMTTYTADALGAINSIAFTRGNVTGAYTTGHMVWLNAQDIGTPFQLVVHDSSDLYFYKRYKNTSTNTWGAWTKMNAGLADQASKLTNITTTDAASSSDTWRRIWFSYTDNATGRPAYDDTFAYQSSTGTLKSNALLINNMGRIQKVVLINAQSANQATGWYRACTVGAASHYGNFLLFLTGGWNNGAPTMAQISVTLRNGAASINVLSGAITGRITSIRLCKTDSNVNSYYLDFYLTATNGATAELVGLFVGNVFISGINTTNTVASGGTAVAETTINGSITLGNKWVYSSPSSAQSYNALVIQPPYHTGGPWYIKAIDDANNAYIHLYYGSTNRMSITHSGPTDIYGVVKIHPNEGNFREGIRIYSYSSWSTIVLGGDDLGTAATGTSANSWSIHNNNGNFYITRSGSNSNNWFGCIGSRWSFSNISNATSAGNYNEAALQIREYNRGGTQADTWGNAPRLTWHWSGRVAAQIGLASNGWLYEAPVTGTTFYRLMVMSNYGSGAPSGTPAAGVIYVQYY